MASYYFRNLRLLLFFLALGYACAFSGEACKSCHPREVAGYQQVAMAHSLNSAGAQPDGTFTYALSGTTFQNQNLAAGVWQSYTRSRQTDKLPVVWAIGSGSHAVGFLLQAGNHLFQSPISYYTRRQAWDMAPGYEQAQRPDFSRPVTLECLTCHADRPQPVPNTLNSYRDPAFDGGSISCDRCHGNTEAHLKMPLPGSILNPAKLPIAERDSICEQCHLAGEIRIPNPGKSLADFQPGEPLESVYTVYVSGKTGGPGIKVISHSEQLALSLCARRSGGKLWCGTCHDPHQKPANPVAYFRDRCLSCHAATLPKSHATPEQGCTSCHMPQAPAKDGGHTAFTDHRIQRRPEPGLEVAAAGVDPTAWREPAADLQVRNLALARVTLGLQNASSTQVIQGFRTLVRLEPTLQRDPFALTELGTILLTAKQPQEAEKRFRRALELRPDFAPYEVNLGAALAEQGELAVALEHLERALHLDPLLETGVHQLDTLYRRQGQEAKAVELMSRYRQAMGITETAASK